MDEIETEYHAHAAQLGIDPDREEMRRKMRTMRRVLHILGCSAALAAFVTSARAGESKKPDYAAQVAPIFRKYCTGCHNAKDAEGGLVLESYDTLLKGGKRGAAMVAKNAERSRLI